MPTNWATVWACFGEAAGLKSGDRVLIHAATGGVGLVAVSFALSVGAIVHATAKPGEKQAYLREKMGVTRISTTRDCAVFVREMGKILGESKLDAVLNSLSHQDYIPESLAMLRDGGHFMEIGKRGIWTEDQMSSARPAVVYDVVAVDARSDEVRDCSASSV